MNCTRLLLVASALAGYAATAEAGTLLYTFGGDFVSLNANGAPDSLNRMDPASVASVTNVQTPVGDGSIGFTGGLVAANALLYGIGNDNNGVATLYSMQLNGQNLTAVSSAFNNTGGAAGIGFNNGLTAVGSTFYAVGQGISSEGLYQIGNGSATLVQTLNTYGGTYAGLAWDASLHDFYGIVANGSTPGFCVADCLVRFALSGPVSVVADLTSLDGSTAGTHLGGLADAGGTLYDIYTNPITFTGELERINLSGPPSATTLYDSGVPLAQNAGIAVITPEPGTAAEIAAALLVLGGIVRRSMRKRQF
jgi:hypothetical protein